MKPIEKTPDLLATLQSFDTFKEIDAPALEWLIEQSAYVKYAKGEELFVPGEEIDIMSVMISGRYLLQLEQNGRQRELGVWGTGYIFGVLPFSRMKESSARGVALEDCDVLELPKSCFVEMVNVSYELTQTLVAFMSTRIRDFTQMRVQEEKLMALGKMSAGLAHELNNPASAMVRSSESLYDHLHQTPERFKSVITMEITPEETDRINEILFARTKNVTGIDLGILDRQERVDDLLDWLDDHDIDKGDDIAETFVDFGMTTEDLDRVDEIVDGRSIEPLVWWLESTLSLERLVTEIRESASRIATLIQAVKGYSHMDRSVSMEPIDICEGLRNTIMVLQHKMKGKGVQLEKTMNEELPRVLAYGSELNQVWTNIIANAIDAVGDKGKLMISTFAERDHVCVDIQDNGPGISEDNLNRIFEPFFTTKGVSEGTGMGLDIVKKIVERHNGYLKVTSVPGETIFRVCLPVEGQMAKQKMTVTEQT